MPRARAPMPRLALRRTLPLTEPGRVELLVRAEQRHAVPGRDALVAPRARDQLVVRPRSRRRSARGCRTARAASRRAARSPRRPRTACRRSRMSRARRPMHASTTDGANSAATSSTPDRAEHLLHRVRDRRVVEIGDDPHLGAQVADQQHRLQRAQVGASPRTRRPRRPMIPASNSGSLRCAAARQMRDAPAAHDPHEPLVRLVVEHHHARARQVQLLDRAQTHRVQAAHDHVADPIAALLGIRRSCAYCSVATRLQSALPALLGLSRASKMRGATALRMASEPASRRGSPAWRSPRPPAPRPPSAPPRARRRTARGSCRSRRCRRGS